MRLIATRIEFSKVRPSWRMVLLLRLVLILFFVGDACPQTQTVTSDWRETSAPDPEETPSSSDTRPTFSESTTASTSSPTTSSSSETRSFITSEFTLIITSTGTSTITSIVSPTNSPTTSSLPHPRPTSVTSVLTSDSSAETSTNAPNNTDGSNQFSMSPGFITAVAIGGLLFIGLLVVFLRRGFKTLRQRRREKQNRDIDDTPAENIITPTGKTFWQILKSNTQQWSLALRK
ncbi:hypothetical protein QBC37DRAFT_393242 [Rhypophila decipiens]|uniref:Uncharacterized protein n=1 Tax=Rhypophila decipiens TaxID=261697 RepID=A0AAN7B3E3_9PEZI|nr:hypothetical protein QBC37DRAFT_393242 [Rhypophila decipiens]